MIEYVARFIAISFDEEYASFKIVLVTSDTPNERELEKNQTEITNRYSELNGIDNLIDVADIDCSVSKLVQNMKHSLLFNSGHLEYAESLDNGGTVSSLICDESVILIHTHHAVHYVHENDTETIYRIIHTIETIYLIDNICNKITGCEYAFTDISTNLKMYLTHIRNVESGLTYRIFVDRMMLPRRLIDNHNNHSI